ncbi:MAG: hypothetical protein HY321_20315 [Armatimonadetes bacterium]|nr:hypothetical protein [Armatimonadota bacterium]
MTEDARPAGGALPQIPLGPYSVSRLIAGSNTINGGTHLSRFLNLQMREYFTEEQTLAFLRRCEDVGINTWQSGPPNFPLLEKHRAAGGRLQYISLAVNDPADPDSLAKVAAARPIGIAHHGEVTDRFFKEGAFEQVREFCKRVRDTGVPVGVSTHMPAVVEHIEEHGWDVDFFMCCVYERHRSEAELKALLGHVPIPVREVYLKEDPPRMFRAVREARKPCLAFKILAAGRVCDRQESVEQAFRETFSQIKPSDAVIVGMYPRYEDQAAINAAYVRRFGGHP